MIPWKFLGNTNRNRVTFDHALMKQICLEFEKDEVVYFKCVVSQIEIKNPDISNSLRSSKLAVSET